MQAEKVSQPLSKEPARRRRGRRRRIRSRPDGANQAALSQALQAVEASNCAGALETAADETYSCGRRKGSPRRGADGGNAAAAECSRTPAALAAKCGAIKPRWRGSLELSM